MSVESAAHGVASLQPRDRVTLVPLLLVVWAPSPRSARLGRGEVPEFLEVIPTSGTPVTSYRVRP